MTLATIILSGLLSLAPLPKDTTKINLNLPEIKYKTETTYDLGMKKTQYKKPVTKNTFLFTEYPALKQLPQQPMIKPKELKIGFIINF